MTSFKGFAASVDGVLVLLLCKLGVELMFVLVVLFKL